MPFEAGQNRKCPALNGVFYFTKKYFFAADIPAMQPSTITGESKEMRLVAGYLIAHGGDTWYSIGKSVC